MKDKPAESCEPRANYLNIVPDSYHCGTCGKNNLPVPPLKHDCMKAETQDAPDKETERDYLQRIRQLVEKVDALEQKLAAKQEALDYIYFDRIDNLGRKVCDVISETARRKYIKAKEKSNG